ncbi:MAG TPA: 2Fe-2S iron-sulfur cluster-binding protein [Thermoanaerobaculia bacterium]|nr:2Fe-2S iron-sulfur cluster-binding protein [Thermoanaerobaculia bacterium]
MPTVIFVPLDKAAATLQDETVLDAARRAGVPLGNACGGIGICGRCLIRPLAGAANLSPPTEIETKVAHQRSFSPGQRLACQCVVRGDCAVTTTYWGWNEPDRNQP